MCRFLLFTLWRPRQPGDIWALPLTGDRTPFAVVQRESDDDAGTLSPDGKWIAYHSDDLGNYQVYVEAFPAGTQRVRISPTSGAGPSWSRDQKSIYYLSTEGRIMAADVSVSGGQLRAQTARELFPAELPSGARNVGHDKSNDRFLLMTLEGREGGRPTRTLTVHTNWLDLIPPARQH